MTEDDIQLKSEEVQEILGTPPSSIVRWGVTVVFLVMLMLAAMSYLIKYPDVVKGKVLITTKNPPIKLSSYAAGYLEKLNVKDQDLVTENQILAIIESTANYDDVLEVENLISQLDTAQNLSSINFTDKRKALGEIQMEYNNFVSAYNSLLFFYNNNLEAQSSSTFKSQINQLDEQSNKIINQKFLLVKEIEILEKQLTERANLQKKGIISAEDYENFKLNYFQKQQQLESLKINLSNIQIQQGELKNGISTNSFTRVFKDNETVMKFEESKDLLMSKINWWKKIYLITSPIAGNVSFGNIWSQNQKIEQGQEIFTIIPEKNDVLAKILVPISSIGKLKTEQKVLVELFSFPANEYGYLESKVNNISLVPNSDNEYLIEATLPSTLTTSFKKEIDFKTEMQGTASIITSKKRIATRIFEKFIDLTNMK